MTPEEKVIVEIDRLEKLLRLHNLWSDYFEKLNKNMNLSGATYSEVSIAINLEIENCKKEIVILRQTINP